MKKITTRNPIFINPRKLKEGVTYSVWFYTDFEPTNGNFRKCSGGIHIRKIDKKHKMIFVSTVNNDGTVNDHIDVQDIDSLDTLTKNK